MTTENAPAGAQDAGAGPSAPDGPKLTPEDLESLRARAAKADEFQDKWLRVNAEIQNLQRRAARDRDQIRRLALRDLVKDLLPSFDNLGRALMAAPASEAAAVLTGVKMVQAEVHRVLTEYGVTPIEPGRERLDPNLHEAVSRRHEPGVEENVILEVHEKGYRLGDLVIRPARVIVASAVPPPEPASS